MTTTTLPTSFETRDQAIAAGYVTLPMVRDLIRSHRIWITDTSGPNIRGYSFALCPSYTEVWILEPIEGISSKLRTDRWQSVDTDVIYARSVSVHLQKELNQVRQPGCYQQMFRREDVERAIQRRSEPGFQEERVTDCRIEEAKETEHQERKARVDKEQAEVDAWIAEAYHWKEQDEDDHSDASVGFVMPVYMIEGGREYVCGQRALREDIIVTMCEGIDLIREADDAPGMNPFDGPIWHQDVDALQKWVAAWVDFPSVSLYRHGRVIA